MAADPHPEPLEIRRLRQADLNRVMEIEERSFPTPWSRRAFEAELSANAYARYLTAWLDETLVGYAGMWIILDEAHITTIAVDPHYRGRRIGSHLLRHLHREAASLGARRLTLEVRRSNEVAKRLYTRHGFVVRGVRHGYYRDNDEDAIIMWKDLAAGARPTGPGSGES